MSSDPSRWHTFYGDPTSPKVVEAHNVADLLARAEKAEKERDALRALIEQACDVPDESSPSGGASNGD